MLKIIKSFLADERGQASTEYAVIIGIVAVCLIGILAAFREKLVEVFRGANTTHSDLPGAIPVE